VRGLGVRECVLPVLAGKPEAVEPLDGRLLAKRGIEDRFVSEFAHNLTMIEVVEDARGVVEHHVHDDIDPAGMGLFDQLGQLALGPSASGRKPLSMLAIPLLRLPVATFVANCTSSAWYRVLNWKGTSSSGPRPLVILP